MALLNSLVNGEVVSEISITDRGLNYGDGLFETILLVNQQVIFWEQHYQRLLTGCDVLAIQCPAESYLKENINKLVQLTADVTPAIIKIIVTRGNSERGYYCTENTAPNVIISLSTYPGYLMDYWNSGINVKSCNTPLSSQPRLAGIKHLNRLEQVIARQEWQDEYQEGIMSDMVGNIIEGVMSNIFIVKQGGVTTPLVDNAGVNGVMRNIILKLCEAHGIMAIKDKISYQALKEADEVFFTNSIIGIWPVREIDWQFDSQTCLPGPVTKKIMQILTEEHSIDYATFGL